MVNFIFFLQATQDRNRRLDARLIDQNFLEAALKRCIFFDVFAVLIERGRADAVQLTARQCRLEHVAGIHRALRFTGADHGVNLVDEKNGLAFILRQFFQHSFQALFKLTAVLRTGEQGGHIER